MPLTDKEKEHQRARYQRLKAAGTCCSCKQTKAVRGGRCKPCWHQHKESTKRRRDERLTAGVCVKCGKEPAVAGLALGVNCSEKINEIARSKRKLRKTSGKCITCRVPVTGASECKSCRKKARAYHKGYYDERRTEGRCTKCGEPTGGFADCEGCRDKDRARRQQLKQRVMTAYGGKCACCPEPITALDFLTIDHVNGDGATHRKAMGGRQFGGEQLYRWLIEHGFPKDFQVLCWNCNLSKQLNDNTCWHKLAS